MFKNLITKEQYVVPKFEKEWTRGYIGPDIVLYQYLVEYTLFCGHKVSRRVLDREVVPEWAQIESGCFGSTEWRSKFAEYIN